MDNDELFADLFDDDLFDRNSDLLNTQSTDSDRGCAEETFLDFESLEMATVLGMAEELFPDTPGKEEDKVEIMSLLADEHVETKNTAKAPPRKSFEAWVRAVNSGHKTVDDPL